MEFGSLITVYETTDKVILCHGTSQKCESFNAEESVNIADTRAPHKSACMGLNRGQPTIIAGKGSHNGTTETFEIRFLNNKDNLFNRVIVDGNMWRHIQPAI